MCVCCFVVVYLLWVWCCCQGDGEGGKKKKGHEKKLKNQFNFSERASQTYNYPLRVSASKCVYKCLCVYVRMYIEC